VGSQTYEITFTGQAGTTLRAVFEDCELTVGPGTTTFRAELPDQAALAGLVQRINGLRPGVIRLRRVAPPQAGYISAVERICGSSASPVKEGLPYPHHL
jgi:hypothetical protein